MNAILENLDAQFDELHEDQGQLRSQVLEQARESRQFDVDQELNVDTLQALLDFRFPERPRNAEETSHLLSLLNSLGMSMGELLNALDTVKDNLPHVQAELVKELGEWYWTQPAAVATALALTNDLNWGETLVDLDRGAIRLIDEWRAKLSDSKAE